MTESPHSMNKLAALTLRSYFVRNSCTVQSLVIVVVIKWFEVTRWSGAFSGFHGLDWAFKQKRNA